MRIDTDELLKDLLRLFKRWDDEDSWEHPLYEICAGRLMEIITKHWGEVA